MERANVKVCKRASAGRGHNVAVGGGRVEGARKEPIKGRIYGQPVSVPFSKGS